MARRERIFWLAAMLLCVLWAGVSPMRGGAAGLSFSLPVNLQLGPTVTNSKGERWTTSLSGTALDADLSKMTPIYFKAAGQPKVAVWLNERNHVVGWTLYGDSPPR